MTEIFISYSRKNSDILKDLLNNLADYPVRCDISILSPGDSWWPDILAAIQKCDLFLFIDTEDSNKSPICKAELDWAISLNRTIIPIRSSNDNRVRLPGLGSAIQELAYDLNDSSRRSSLITGLNHAHINSLPTPIPEERRPKDPTERINKFGLSIKDKLDEGPDKDGQFLLVKEIENELMNLPLEMQERYLPFLQEFTDNAHLMPIVKHKSLKIVQDIKNEISKFIIEYPAVIKTIPPWNADDDKYVKDLANEIRSGKCIPFLGPGLNPNLYTNLEKKIVDLIGSEYFPFEWEHADELSKQVAQRQRVINAVIGLPCNSCHFYVLERPDGKCPMLGELQTDKIDDPIVIEQELSIAINNIRYLADFYLLTNKKKQRSFQKLGTLLTDTFCVEDSFEDPYGIYAFFKNLPNKLSERGLPRNFSGEVFDLSLTTNFVNSSYLQHMTPDHQVPNGQVKLNFYFDIQEFYPLKPKAQSERIAFCLESGASHDLLACKDQYKQKPTTYDISYPWILTEDDNRLFLNNKSSESRRVPIIISLHGLLAENNLTFLPSADPSNSSQEEQPDITLPILSKTQVNMLQSNVNMLPMDIGTALQERPIFLIGFSKNDLEIQQTISHLSYDKSGHRHELDIYFVYQEPIVQTLEDRTHQKLSTMAWESISEKIKLIPVPSLKEFIEQFETTILSDVGDS